MQTAVPALPDPSLRSPSLRPSRTELAKTATYLAIHLTVGFSVAYALTGSVEVAGGIALIEPCVNAVAFFFHERAWQADWRVWRRRAGDAVARWIDSRLGGGNGVDLAAAAR